MEVQGASSAAYAKELEHCIFSDPALTKPLTIKIGDLLPHDELVYKANWIDHTNIRNAMCYRLWEQFCSTRTGYPRLEVETPLIGKKVKMHFKMVQMEYRVCTQLYFISMMSFMVLAHSVQRKTWQLQHCQKQAKGNTHWDGWVE